MLHRSASPTLPSASRRRTLAWTLLLAAGLGSCGGGGGETVANPPGGGTTLPPGPLSYAESSLLLRVDQAFAGAPPTVQGADLQFSIDPALPAGVAIDAQNGRIVGTPQARSPRGMYKVEVQNAAGSSSFALDLAVSGPSRFAYAANSGDSTISIYAVEGASGMLRPIGFHAQVPGDVQPEALWMHPDGGLLFTANEASSTLATLVLDAQGGRVLSQQSAPIDAGPHALRATADGRHLFVLARGAGSVTGFEVADDGGLTAVSNPVWVGGDPFELLVDPLGRYLIVLRATGSVATFRIDAQDGTLEETSTTSLEGGVPAGGALAPGGTDLYVSVQGVDEVQHFAVDPSAATIEEMAAVAAGVDPTMVVVHPSGTFAYVFESSSGALSRYRIADAGGELTPLPGDGVAPAGVDRLVFSEDGARAWGVDRDGAEVSLLAHDSESGDLAELERVRARSEPAGLAVASAGSPPQLRTRSVYVANRDSGDVTSFRFDSGPGTLTWIDSDAAGTGPSGVALDPWGRFALVCNAISGDVHAYTVEDDGTLSWLGAPLAIGGQPSAIIIDPSGRFAFVADELGNRVVRLGLAADGTPTLLGSEPVGTRPVDVRCSPSGDFLYLANLDGGGLSQFSIDAQTGALGALSPAFAYAQPTRIEFVRGGERAYAVLSAGNILVPYEATPNTGELIFVPPGTRALSVPVDMDITSSGRFAYSAMQHPASQGGVLVFDVREGDGALWNEQTEELTWTGWALVGSNPVALESDPAEDFLFVLTQSTHSLSLLRIDDDDGQLTPLQDELTGLAPTSLALRVRVE